jgi:hypothetical protein
MLSPDYIVRISLIRDEETLIELNPPVWRRFKMSSAVNLDLMVDKISKCMCLYFGMCIDLANSDVSIQLITHILVVSITNNGMGEELPYILL